TGVAIACGGTINTRATTPICNAPRPPIVRPPNPRPPVARPPHRPGIGRPPQFRPIHRPPFRYPPGYRYQRWSIGGLLPLLFLSNSYYYDGWYDLGLGAPPRGYRWVRYGPDLLLVNIRTRRVVDVIYGAFY
ncbi:RcnB family protein, partial [Sphingomonas sp. Sphisp140]|uniref:RcnB family protein n=1 Tax=Sphingomonas sp. Sphisp140 TaxID=3243019 RepID=UPI0039AF3BB0